MESQAEARDFRGYRTGAFESSFLALCKKTYALINARYANVVAGKREPGGDRGLQKECRTI
jgi:hypothetical protein